MAEEVIPPSSSPQAMPAAAALPETPAHDLSPRAVKKRLGLNLLANIYNQGVTVAVQLLAIPLFLSAWGAQQYGVWLAVNALPFYFYAISDLGFVNLAANEMAMRRARNELPEAIRIFHSATVVVLAMSLLVLVVAVSVVGFIPFARWLNIPPQFAEQSLQALTILLSQLPLVLILGLLNAGFRADGRYAVGAICLGTSRLLDGLVPAAVAQLGGTLTMAAASMLAVKLTSLVVVLVVLRYQVAWLRIGVGSADRRLITGMLAPAAAFVAMPLAHMLQITGTTLIVSAVAGPTAVATFNVIRTLGNLAFAAFGIIMNAVWVEVSSLLGGGKLDLVRALNRRVANLSFWMAALACAVLAVAGGPILSVWTGGEVQMHYAFFYLQLFSILLASLWRVSGVVLLASNNHRLYTIPLLIAALVQLLVTWATVPRLGLAGAGVAMLMTEVVMVAAVMKPALRLLSDNGSSFMAAVLTPPRPSSVWQALPRRRSANGAGNG